MTKRIICALVICIVMLSVTAHAVSADSFPFTDVKRCGWQYTPIKKVYDLGIMNGVSPTRFEPAGKLTRAQAAMILYNLEGGGISYRRYSFKDVRREPLRRWQNILWQTVRPTRRLWETG